MTTSGAPGLFSQVPGPRKYREDSDEGGKWSRSRKGSRDALNHHSRKGKARDRVGVRLPSETGLLSAAARGQGHFCPDTPLAPVPPRAESARGQLTANLGRQPEE